MASPVAAAGRRSQLAGGCLVAVGLALTLCLGGVGFAYAWTQSPALHGHTGYIYACVGAKVDGPLRFGYAWASNLSGLTPLYVSLPITACGFYPRPPFLALFGVHIFQLF
jgi:hypothetical protein